MAPKFLRDMVAQPARPVEQLPSQASMESEAGIGLGLPQLDYAPRTLIQSERACGVMATWLAFSLKGALVSVSADSGAAIRIAKNDYAFAPSPEEQPLLTSFADGIRRLDVDVAYCLGSEVVKAITTALPFGTTVIALGPTQNIQVIETMAELGQVRSAQRACFVRAEDKLILWSDDAEAFQKDVIATEQLMIRFIWQHSDSVTNRVKGISSPVMPTRGSFPNSPSNMSWIGETPPMTHSASFGSDNKYDEKSPVVDHEAQLDGHAGPAERTNPLQGALLTGLSIGLSIFILSISLRTALHEYFLDYETKRFWIMFALPFMFLVLMYFSQMVVDVISRLILPSYYKKNTLFYSADPPVRRQLEYLPHMTVVIPVYKESLTETVAPSIESINTAIRTYELQGGTANLIVCEDGLQLVDDEERAMKIEYYERRNAAWVARPKENRAGRFKKSSNLNTMKALSLRIESLMDVWRPTNMAEWTAEKESALYERCLTMALKEKDGKIWANGNIRIGEYILLVDSDTRVPEDCFLDAALEMEASPEVAILQYCSGSFLAGGGFFETGMGFFTLFVNFAISLYVSNGIVAPFMGHNAFLRWSALQEQALTNPGGLVWSEEHVSEDFVMSMCVMEAGYTIRWATYTDQFLEGVSLTAIDELNRWQKYAYGSSEICINPLRKWLTSGPITPLFRRYLSGPSPLSHKWSNVAYLFSYLAIAVGAPMSVAMYVVQGLFMDNVDLVLPLQLNQFIAVLFTFLICGFVSSAFSRFRNGQATFATAVLHSVLWLPMITVFFSGLSYHVCAALLAHLTGYNMQWSSTEKEVSRSNIWHELPKIASRFWVVFLLFIPFIVGQAIMATDIVPLEWRIESTAFILPAAWCAAGHLLFPFLLNPFILRLSY